jgi:hypothetical protein
MMRIRSYSISKSGSMSISIGGILRRLGVMAWREPRLLEYWAYYASSSLREGIDTIALEG